MGVHKKVGEQNSQWEDSSWLQTFQVGDKYFQDMAMGGGRLYKQRRGCYQSGVCDENELSMLSAAFYTQERFGPATICNWVTARQGKILIGQEII